MKDENRTLTLDYFDHRLIVRALNDLRTDQVQQKKPTEDIDDLMLRVIDAPKTKHRKRRRDAR